VTDSTLFWNQVALDAVKIDFSTDKPDDHLVPQQGGPTRTSRALAIVHLAMYDAFAATSNPPLPTYLTYTPADLPSLKNEIVARVAVSSAACLALTDLYSKQAARLQSEHQDFTAMLGATNAEMQAGITWGSLVATTMLASRANDGSGASEAAYAPSPLPGAHRVDPVNPTHGFLGPLWGKVDPFGIKNLVSTVPTEPPPVLTDQLYTDDYNKVLKMGVASGSTRTPHQTSVGLFWAYDGGRNIGVPPRLYNQVVRAISEKHASSEIQNAKLFAVINVAMADAGIQAWAEKYKYNFWRPVLGIREADSGWGPTGIGDGNVGTTGDPYWLPLGAPATNQPARSAFTPPFPAYPSGHATFGTAALIATSKVLAIPLTFAFDFVSDELDGLAVGATGLRAKLKHSLTIAQAIEENILSRVYLGVHWEFDCREGERAGDFIGTEVAATFPKDPKKP